MESQNIGQNQLNQSDLSLEASYACDRSVDLFLDRQTPFGKVGTESPRLARNLVKNSDIAANNCSEISGMKIVGGVNHNPSSDICVQRPKKKLNNTLEGGQKVGSGNNNDDHHSYSSHVIHKSLVSQSSERVEGLKKAANQGIELNQDQNIVIEKSEGLKSLNSLTSQNPAANSPQSQDQQSISINEQIIVPRGHRVDDEDGEVSMNHQELDISIPAINRLPQERESNNNQQQQQRINIEEEEKQFDRREKEKKLHKFLSSNAKLKIRTAFGAYLAVFAVSLVLLCSRSGSMSYIDLFIVSYMTSGYYLLESTIQSFSYDPLKWKRVENISRTIDILAIIYVLVISHLKMLGTNIPLKFSLILPVINIAFYASKSTITKRLKSIYLTLRCILTLQLALIAMRLDENIDWPWELVLSFSWFFFGLVGVFSVLVFITFVSTVTGAFFKVNLTPYVGIGTQIIGFFWMTLYSCLGVVAFLILIGAIIAFKDEEDSSFLVASLVTGSFLSVFLVILTVGTYPVLVNFLLKFDSDETEYREFLGIPELLGTQPRITTEKKSVYLVKLSSTFFSTFNKSLGTVNKDAQRKLKKDMKQIQVRRFQRKAAHITAVAHEAENSKTVNIEVLRKEKQDLDKIFKAKQGLLNLDIGKFLPSILPRRNRSEAKPQKSQRDMTINASGLHNNGKICLSEGVDHEIAGEKSDFEASEHYCYICCARAPNAVTFECGHGGVCLECAVETIQAKGQCMECRGGVKKIIVIDPEPIMDDIIKGSEIITIPHRTGGGEGELPNESGYQY